MKAGGNNSQTPTGNNCGLNCFMGSRQKMKPSKPESLWPKFRRRVNHDGKSMTVKISPAGNETEKPDSFVLSFSRGGEVIPVKIVPPKENAQKISVKRRKNEGKGSRRSWVRSALGAFRFSTKKSPNGKVIQDPPSGRDSEIVPVEPVVANQRPVDQVPNSDPRDSTPRPKASEERNAIHPLNRKNKAINRVQGHVTAPSSPLKGASPSSSHSNLPRLIKLHRLAPTILDSEAAEQNPPRREFAIGFSVVIIILFCLAISDKLFAIVCTSIWFYAVPKLRSIGKAKEPQKDNKNPQMKKIMIKSLSNSNIDLHSSEYRKKVIMEGILQRNHKLP